jgi:hypothetical protein
MYIGLLDQRCIAFKCGESDIRVFMRRHVHGFHHFVTSESKEMVCGENLTNYKSFLVSDDNYISVHCAEEFHETHRVTVPTCESETIEVVEVITMKVSKC